MCPHAGGDISRTRSEPSGPERESRPGMKPEDKATTKCRNAPISGWFPERPPHHSLHSTFGLSVTDYNLNVEVRGPADGPPLLLLHGWGRSLQDMRPLAQELSDTCRTHAVDLPGHGASPPPPEPWGVSEHAQVLHGYIRDEIRAGVTIVGHSNGGRIALYLASRPDFSSSINRLALISPSGVEPERSWSYHLRSGLATALKAPVQRLPSSLQDPVQDWLRHSLVWRLLGSADYNAQDGVMRETFVKTVNYHLNGELRRIQVPTLLFWGTEDEAVSRRQMEVMEKQIDDCGLVELDGAGHFGHLDQPQPVLSGLRHFLENS